MAKWIEFIERPVGEHQKTLRWQVRPKDSFEPLGMVQWFNRWRKYCFFPAPDTVFEQDCLRDIAHFIEQETQRQRHSAALRRSNGKEKATQAGPE